MAGADRYLISLTSARSDLHRSIPIKRLREQGERGVRDAQPPATKPSAARLRLTGVGRSRPPRTGLARFLVEGRARDEANSFVAFRRYAGALAGRVAVQGGAGGRDSPAWSKSATQLEFPARAYLGYARSTLDVPTDAGQGVVRGYRGGIGRATAARPLCSGETGHGR